MCQLSEKQRQVYELLLTPVKCSKAYADIVLCDGVIRSGQKYKNAADEDMSDFAVGFYQVLYKDFLKCPLLNADGPLVNSDFAGDTMNSFESIANATEEAGNSKRKRTDIDDWPVCLQEYFWQYHCLANFWLLPMKLGRTSMKLNRYDSLDIFLNAISDDYSIIENYFNYSERISDFDVFCKAHYVVRVRDSGYVESLYKGKQGFALVSNAMTDIRNRAFMIATSCYTDDLWEWLYLLELC